MKTAFSLFIPNYVENRQPTNTVKVDREGKSLTSTYDAPKLAAAMNDCQDQKDAVFKCSSMTHLNRILTQLQ
jgi:hypothetical protein